MGKLKSLTLYLIIIFSLSTIGAMCPHNYGEQFHQLEDLRLEVESLQRKLDEKKDQRDKLQKEIASKDAKIRELQNQTAEVIKRCP